MSNSKSIIKSRQEGKDILTWIEHFGLHFLEDDKYNGKPNSEDHFLIMRINSSKDNDYDTIYAYYCFFKTDKDGVTKFCVKKQCQYTQDRLRKLLKNAQWNFPKTINWWQEVFHNGFQDIDDILGRPEIVVSDSCNLKMQDFLQQINDVIKDSIQKLDLGTTKITKVCMVEQYAYALPLKYVLFKMFPNSFIYTYVFKDKSPMRNHSWLDPHPFYISTALLNKSLNTTSALTIADVLHLGENGITITMPLTNEELDSPFIDGCELKWGDLLPDDVQSDYQVGNLKFKRMRLTMRADGFQNIYITGIGESAVITLEDDKMTVLYKKSTTDEHQIIESIVPESISQTPETNLSGQVVPKPSSTGEKGVPSDEARHQIATLFFDGSDRFIIVARKNIEELFKKEYQDEWKTEMKKTFCKGKYRNLDFGNFPSFITANKDMLVKYWGGDDSYFQVKNSAYALHKLRNKNSHHEINSVIDQGKAEVSRVFSDMIRVIKIMGDPETAKKIEDLNLKLDTIWWIQ